MTSPSLTTLPLPPGPRRAELPSWLRLLRSDTLGALDRAAETYGDVAMLRVGRRGIVIARGAQAARHVLLAAQDEFVKARQFELYRPVLGLGLVTSSGETWRRSRRMVQPLFAKRHLGVYADHMAAAATAALDDWDATWDLRDPVRVDEHLLRIGLDTVARALVTNDLAPYARQVEVALSGALGAISELNLSTGVTVGSELLGGPQRAARLTSPRRWRRYQEHADTTIRIANAMVDARYAEGQGDKDDLLRLLMETEDDEGRRLSREQVSDELRTIIGAGHETTAHGLTWMFHLLADHPEARARAEEEVDTVLAQGPLDAARAEQLTWLTACFQEAMRLFPPVWAVPRTVEREQELCGHRIPAGSGVIVSIWSTHRDPGVYDDPHRFDPSRWLGDAPAQRPRFAYLPFGGGRRACVGQGFAMLNAQILGALVMSRYRFDRAPAAPPVVLSPGITLRPKHGIVMQARRRAA